MRHLPTGLLFALLLGSCTPQADPFAGMNTAVESLPVSHCYLQVTTGAARASGTDTIPGPVDSLWISMDVVGELVNGEYRWLPAEKDRKTGTFTGTLENGVVTALLTYTAEGMNAKEEILLRPEAGGVRVGSGELARSEGVWLFKKKELATYGDLVPEVPCAKR